jgi:hypothetical protein
MAQSQSQSEATMPKVDTPVKEIEEVEELSTTEEGSKESTTEPTEETTESEMKEVVEEVVAEVVAEATKSSESSDSDSKSSSSKNQSAVQQLQSRSAELLAQGRACAESAQTQAVSFAQRAHEAVVLQNEFMNWKTEEPVAAGVAEDKKAGDKKDSSDKKVKSEDKALDLTDVSVLRAKLQTKSAALFFFTNAVLLAHLLSGGAVSFVSLLLDVLVFFPFLTLPAFFLSALGVSHTVLGLLLCGLALKLGNSELGCEVSERAQSFCSAAVSYLPAAIRDRAAKLLQTANLDKVYSKCFAPALAFARKWLLVKIPSEVFKGLQEEPLATLLGFLNQSVQSVTELATTVFASVVAVVFSVLDAAFKKAMPVLLWQKPEQSFALAAFLYFFGCCFNGVLAFALAPVFLLISGTPVIGFANTAALFVSASTAFLLFVVFNGLSMYGLFQKEVAQFVSEELAPQTRALVDSAKAQAKPVLEKAQTAACDALKPVLAACGMGKKKTA